MVREFKIAGFVCLFGGVLSACPAESASNEPPGVNPPVAGVGGTGGSIAGGTGGTGGSVAGTGGSIAGTGGSIAGTGGSEAGTGGMAGTMAGTGGSGPAEDLGEGDGMDVITIGDSMMKIASGNEGIEVSLEKVSARNYRNFGGTGAPNPFLDPIAMTNGVIPGQYNTAKMQDPDISTVVATGGGNDGIEMCENAATEADMTPACKQKADEINAAIDQMLEGMATDGVKDVVWIIYGELSPMGREFGGIMENLRRVRMENCTLDNPALAPMRCHVVDPKAAIAGKYRDGAHPTAEGYDIIGQMVWDKMQEAGIRR